MGLLWLVPAAPLLGALILGLAGELLPRRAAGYIGTASVGVAAAVALGILLQWIRIPPPGAVFAQPLWTLLMLPGLTVRVALYLDPLALLMMLVITVIGTLIHLFSTEYMEGEAGFSRYFAYLNLFVASMLLLVLADDLLLLFIGWEGVGVCSYLLVGFWFAEPANGYAARKSFVVTRVADTAMLAGLLLLAAKFGTLNIQSVLSAASATWPVGAVMPALACALLLIGGLGKSAQVPFQTWLPDAMAGPTPVSALIHAATMVTAGVYLVVRLHPLFVLAPGVLATLGLVAAVTLLLASTAALVQSDIKRVLAYSTVAQIGYMFLALSVGAWSAAMFHFLTHAVFKALLFLSAGAVAMRLHHEQDIFKMGGLASRLRLACFGFVVGGSALAALPLITAGSFSKEMILGAVWLGRPFGPALWAAALLGAVLTATYIFRAVFLVFLGPARTEVSGDYGWAVAVPLLLLAIAALSIGWLQTPAILGGRSVISDFLAPAVGTSAAEGALQPLVQLAGVTAPLLGLAFAYAGWRSGYWRRAAERREAQLRDFAKTGFGFDFIYHAILVRPFLALAQLLRGDPVDLLFAAMAQAAMAAHRRLRAGQTGQLRRYAGWMMAGSAAVLALAVFR
jgi:NADH-quinone oxidoreductase subunit L